MGGWLHPIFASRILISYSTIRLTANAVKLSTQNAYNIKRPQVGSIGYTNTIQDTARLVYLPTKIKTNLNATSGHDLSLFKDSAITEISGNKHTR